MFNWLFHKSKKRSINDQRAKETVLKYYDGLPKTSINEEEEIALDYLRNHELCVFPYPFQEKYNRENVSVYKDGKLKLKYVLLDGKPLYFKRESSTQGIKGCYNSLLIEQDLDSSHRYLTDSFNLESNDILVDIGAAEGNFSLSIVEKVKKVYLFETDLKWIEALKATFSRWENKVEIVNKFVSNKNDETTVSLDQFFKDREMFNFLKIDAEGAEEEVLYGCEGLLSSNRKIKLALCCYHRPDDERKFNEFLVKRGFSVSFSKGYMIYNEPKTFSPPYLRRGLIRAEKLNESA